jgi:murein DD-endopeptidase MepM/ murein hydrolase activator NlpD
MKKSCIFLLLLISLAFLIEGALADNNCTDNTICVEAEAESGFVDFYVKNLKSFDVTITLTLDTVNLKSPDQLPYTETVSGKSKVKIFHLPVIDKKRKWTYKYHVNWTRGSKYARHDNSYTYSLPYKKDTAHKILQSFDGKFSHGDGSRYAVDFSMPEGTPVHASRGGIVVGVREDNNTGGPTKDFEGLANHVIIRHQDGTIGEYLHLKKDGAAVEVDDSVNKGQIIGYSGNTGFSTGPHLHFGVYKTYNGKKRISFPIKFTSADGILSCPVKGESYTAD